MFDGDGDNFVATELWVMGGMDFGRPEQIVKIVFCPAATPISHTGRYRIVYWSGTDGVPGSQSGRRCLSGIYSVPLVRSTPLA
jgi:hypothetical protein